MPRFSIINYKLFYEDINQDIFKYFKNEEKLNTALRITLILFFWNHLIVFSTLPAQSLYIPIRTIKFLFWKKMVLVFISWKKCFYEEFWQIRRKEFDLVLLTVVPRFVTLLTLNLISIISLNGGTIGRDPTVLPWVDEGLLHSSFFNFRSSHFFNQTKHFMYIYCFP